jgi:ankyrin repeat protein
MSLMKCPECNLNVSDMATDCPHCGYPVYSWPAGRYLHQAAINGDEVRIRKAIANGTDVDIRDPDSGDTPLIMASFWDRESTVTLLLSLNANINAQNNDGYTPLFWPVCKNYRGLVSLLLAKGASLDIGTTTGLKPIHWAATYGELGVLELGPMDLLITAGANVNDRDNSGETPLHHAVRHVYDVRAKYLLSHGADVNAKDNNGHTPLHAARVFGSKKMVKLLKANGGFE